MSWTCLCKAGCDPIGKLAVIGTGNLCAGEEAYSGHHACVYGPMPKVQMHVLMDEGNDMPRRFYARSASSMSTAPSDGGPVDFAGLVGVLVLRSHCKGGIAARHVLDGPPLELVEGLGVHGVVPRHLELAPGGQQASDHARKGRCASTCYLPGGRSLGIGLNDCCRNGWLCAAHQQHYTFWRGAHTA